MKDFKQCTCMTKSPEPKWHRADCAYRLWSEEREENMYVDCGPCSYRGTDGGPGPVMTCDHPQQTHGTFGMGVVSWNDEKTKRQALRAWCPLEK